MKKIILLAFLAIGFSQDGISLTMKAIKVGVDINSDYRVRIEGNNESIFLEDPFSLAAEVSLNSSFDAGLELMMESDAQAMGVSVSHMSLYGLYKFYSDEDISIMPKFGFSTMNYSMDSEDQDYYDYYGSGFDIDSEGGLMYGFQIEYKNMIHISYTRHSGKFEYNVPYVDNSKFKTLTSRFNISYAFKL